MIQTSLIFYLEIISNLYLALLWRKYEFFLRKIYQTIFSRFFLILHYIGNEHFLLKNSWTIISGRPTFVFSYFWILCNIENENCFPTKILGWLFLHRSYSHEFVYRKALKMRTFFFLEKKSRIIIFSRPTFTSTWFLILYYIIIENIPFFYIA